MNSTFDPLCFNTNICSKNAELSSAASTKTPNSFRRYMANQTLFDDLVAKARSLPSSYSTIGGNAAVMALRFAKEGCDVTLAAKLTTSLHQMIPQVVNIVGGEVKRDDIHLVMEYKHGDVWGPYSSARANRCDA